MGNGAPDTLFHLYIRSKPNGATVAALQYLPIVLYKLFLTLYQKNVSSDHAASAEMHDH